MVRIKEKLESLKTMTEKELVKRQNQEQELKMQLSK